MSGYNDNNHALITTKLNSALEELLRYIKKKNNSYAIFTDNSLKNLATLLENYNEKYDNREEIKVDIKRIIEKEKKKGIPETIIKLIEGILEEDKEEKTISNRIKKTILYVYLHHSEKNWLSSIKNNLLADKKVLYGLSIHTEKKVSILNEKSILVELNLNSDQIFCPPSSGSDNPENGKRIFITSVKVEDIISYTTADGITISLSYNQNSISIVKKNDSNNIPLN